MSELDDERAVLADELQQRGDPQGELIALQLALAALPADAPAARKNLIERRIAGVLERDHEAIYGALAPNVQWAARPDLFDPALEVYRWTNGFADAIWLQTTRGDTLALPDTYRAMRALPIARFVRELAIGRGDHLALVGALEDDPPPALRKLVIGSHRRSIPTLRDVKLVSIQPLAPIVGQLEELSFDYPLAYEPIVAPSLRALKVFNNYAEDPPDFEGELRVLERVVLAWLRIPPAIFERMPALEDADFGACTFAPGWLDQVLPQPAFRLRRLVLGNGLTDDDLGTLVRYRDRIAGMESLVLSRWRFTTDALARTLQYLPPCVTFS